MKNAIKTLPIEISNLIAAGEVVERPASVVKELVENSIDAGASIIKVELNNSGINSIKVADNGFGMTKEELPKSLLPHTTSKIQTSDDLFNISSLGFRGEALPSIASISKMVISSSTNSLDGYFLKIEGGKIIDEGAVAHKIGTIVQVDELFYNTPARLKNLSNESVELSHIILLINRFALSNPSISFSLFNNNKPIFKSSGDNNVISIINEIYGNDAASNMVEFKNHNGVYEISGYTTNNNIYRSNKNSINIIINNRIIRNLNILYGVTDAYQSIIPINKYSITVLNIKCDPSLIDVNVHPSKLEIRFTDESGLRNLITKTLNSALYQSELVYYAKESDIKNEVETPIIKTVETKSFAKTEKSLEELWNEFADEKDETQEIKNESPATAIENNNIDDYSFETLLSPQLIIQEEEKVEYNETPLIKETNDPFANLKYIGQYNQTYLLLEDDNDLYLIDQHAAMERVMYEKIKKSMQQNDELSYQLLVPLKIDFSLSEQNLVKNQIDNLKNINIEIEFFGGNSFLIRSIPNWIPKNYEVEYVSDIINHLINNRNVSKDIMLESLARTMACKKSIKANMLAIKEEAEALIDSLKKCEMPYTCPHGRPTLVKITKYEVEKMFKRVI